MHNIRYDMLLRSTLVLLVTWVAGELRAEIPVKYGWSENGQYGVRILPGDLADHTAKAILLEFDAESKTYVNIGTVSLPNRRLPLYSLLTNDGRYFLNVGNFSGGDDLSAAVTIYDLKLGINSEFSLTDIFAQEDISTPTHRGQFTRWLPHYQHWIDAEGDSAVLINEEAKLAYVFGINRQSSTKRPTVVIDLTQMSVAIEKPTYWHALYDEEATRQDVLTDRYLSGQSGYQYDMYMATKATLRKPRIEVDHLGTTHLFRFEPGNGPTNARMQAMRFNQETQEFDLLNEITLENPIAPLMRAISADAKYIVTFDEIDRIGTTPNAVVIYQLETGRTHAFSLEDFMPVDAIARLPSNDRIRLWHFEWSWIKIEGGDFERWNSLSQDADGFRPHIVIDVENLDVKLAEPFTGGNPETNACNCSGSALDSASYARLAASLN